jgi:hypothetical protein
MARKKKKEINKIKKRSYTYKKRGGKNPSIVKMSWMERRKKKNEREREPGKNMKEINR